MRRWNGGRMGTIAAAWAIAGAATAVAQIEVLSDDELSIGAKFAVAIERDDLEKVRALVEAGNSPNGFIDYGEEAWSILMKAAWDGRVEIARYLMDSGADANLANGKGETALMQALGREQTEVVRLLLARGARVDVIDPFGFWPIHKAAAAGNVEILELLAGAKSPLEPEMYGLTPLMFAVSAGSEPAIRALLALGADVNYASRTGNVGQTALVSALQTGNVEMTRLLLGLGGNPNAATADGTTLLAQARNGDQKEIEALLLAAGARDGGAGALGEGGGESASALSPSAAREQLAAAGVEFTPEAFLDSCFRGDEATVELFLAGGMAATTKGPRGSALDDAITQKQTAVARRLVAAGADPNELVDSYGATILSRAVDMADVEIVRALLEAGANPNAANQYQITPLMSASLEGRLDVVRALVGNGAKVVAREPNGGSALMYAVLRGHVEVVRTLLAAGADVDRDREVLLEIARREGHAEIVTLLEP